MCLSLPDTSLWSARRSRQLAGQAPSPPTAGDATAPHARRAASSRRAERRRVRVAQQGMSVKRARAPLPYAQRAAIVARRAARHNATALSAQQGGRASPAPRRPCRAHPARLRMARGSACARAVRRDLFSETLARAHAPPACAATTAKRAPPSLCRASAHDAQPAMSPFVCMSAAEVRTFHRARSLDWQVSSWRVRQHDRLHRPWPVHARGTRLLGASRISSPRAMPYLRILYAITHTEEATDSESW